MLANKRNEKPDEHLSQLDSDAKRVSQEVEATEIHKSKDHLSRSFSEDPDRKQTESEKHNMQSSVTCGSDDSMLNQTPVSKSSNVHRVLLTDEEISNSSSQFSEYSTFTTPSRIYTSSVLERSSLVDNDGSCIDDSAHFGDSFHLREHPSQVDSTSYTEEEDCTAFDTTREDLSSVDVSRDDTLDSTREGEGKISDAEETKDSLQMESSHNNTSQMEESSDMSSTSRSCVTSQPSCTGTVLKLMIMGIFFIYFYIFIFQQNIH